MGYTFSTLNDRDLEELASDLLRRWLGLYFQSFKPGIDGGVDLRHSAAEGQNDIIVQVKHYVNSGIKQLKSDLKRNELPKVITLNPARYILVTSVPLSDKDKSTILKGFHPYIHNTSDILGAEDLNTLLRAYRDVEDKHFKLWLCNTNVLQRILNNAVKGRSRFSQEKIKREASLFVLTAHYNEAVAVLNKYGFILLTGIPGVGKSTLADMLTMKYLAEDYELFFVRTVEEVESVYLEDAKQLFYFDDVLGKAALDLYGPNINDTPIVDLVDRVRLDKTKRLIMTSRTIIVNQAREMSEELSNSKLGIGKYEVKLSGYGKYDKARILYNHIYHSKLPEQFKQVFIEERYYWDIINHSNYNPRLIEFMTDDDGQFVALDSNFKKGVKYLLDNPHKVWEKSVVEVIRYFEKRQASSRKAVLKSTGKATLYFKQVPASCQFAKPFPTSRA